MSSFHSISLKDRFPKFLSVLCFTEMWERFSYYGMRALLVLFLTAKFGFQDEKAYAIYALFAAIGYAGPVIGGFLADRLMGFYHMVSIGAIIMLLGHAMLALGTHHIQVFYYGLALIAIGTGLFKGNITNLLGASYQKKDPNRERGFTLFYVGVNTGAFSAPIACAYLAKTLGWHYGFGLAGFGLLIGIIAFTRYKSTLWNYGKPAHEERMNQKVFLGLKPYPLVFIASLVASALIALIFNASEGGKSTSSSFLYFGGFVFIAIGYILFSAEAKYRKSLAILGILLLFQMLFFAVEMQLGSLINLFIERNVIKELFGVQVPAAAFQSINPLFVIIFGILFSFFLKSNNKYSVFKFCLGLLTMALCFFTLYLGCLSANSEGQVSQWYLWIAMFLMGIGELWIAPLIQALVSILAPKQLRGLVMGVLFLSMCFANLLAGVVAKWMAIPSVNGKVNPLESLFIYQSGFFSIAKFNLGLTGVFAIMAPFIYKGIKEAYAAQVK